MRNAEHDSDRCFKPGCTMCCKHTKAALHDDPKWDRAACSDANDDDGIDHKKKRELVRQRKAARRVKGYSHS